MTFTKSLSLIRKKDVRIAGGKGAVLGELMNLGFPVPHGIVVLTNAYENLIKDPEITLKINTLNKLLEEKSINEYQKIGQEIITLIESKKLADSIKNEIELNCRNVTGLFAIRSSATCEDSISESWAGELETFLNVQIENVPEKILACWASLFSQRALEYRAKKSTHLKKEIKVAVVVQQMVEADVAGVCFTADPFTKDTSKITIEAAWGSGENVVSGNVTPDFYSLDKSTGQLVEQNEMSNTLQLTQIQKICKMAKKIENEFSLPQDIEWAFHKETLFVLQARPITNSLIIF